MSQQTLRNYKASPTKEFNPRQFSFEASVITVSNVIAFKAMMVVEWLALWTHDRGPWFESCHLKTFLGDLPWYQCTDVIFHASDFSDGCLSLHQNKNVITLPSKLKILNTSSSRLEPATLHSTSEAWCYTWQAKLLGFILPAFQRPGIVAEW